MSRWTLLTRAALLLALSLPMSETSNACALLASRCAPAPLRPSAHRVHSLKRTQDLSGLRQEGKASVYGAKFIGRIMADGERMRAHSDNAASLTLPLGTLARVTNIHTGQSAVVTIEDRGPYVRGRIVDVSPFVAQLIGLDRKHGVVKVTVDPIALPLPDGRVMSGVAAAPLPSAFKRGSF
jgi:rare lipoprotein A